ncbi:la-related protein Larp4B-like isoform X1 [Macrobrachium nipponense]|uniref:la-related protein Larp4B-like isoform X1 n=1 Tax=Macrobrachium nipponense TaxID=159736 RepID=UPI0030C8AC11
MRRSGPVGGGGVGGFSKPPPAPLTHGSSGRVRLHTPEVNGSLGKDRFGSPRERSPSLVGSLPLSPSHPSSREKSPNPASQDLHDCSMCLSAYIQSLNTVCGTACRLSQCLAQVSTENGLGDPYVNAGQTTANPVREAADAWEGVARAVGVASAAVKTQMLVLLQEVQSRPDISDTVRRQEINRVTQAMLSAFLGLQYQFSAVVIERFTGILQNLRDESQCVSSQQQASMLLNKSTNSGVPAHPTDLSQGNSQYPQSGQQPWVPGQQQQQQVTTGSMKNVQAVPLLESPGKEEKARSRHPSGGHSRHTSSAPGWSNSSSGVTGCPSSTSYSSNSNYGSSLSLSVNTLSPGSCYGLFPYMNGSSSGWPNDALSRRWSMGGPSTDGWERNSSLGPFTLIANRRWSVPEASEHDVNTQSESDTDFYGCGLQGDWNGTMGSSAASWGSRGGLHVPSRDSSVTRSPSHSRSVTPDPSRQPSFVSNEELQEVIDLLSLPIITDVGGNGNGVGAFSGFAAGGSVSGGCGAGETSGNGSGTGGGGCSSGGGGGRGGASPVTFSPSHHSSLTQLFEEANKQQKQQQQPQQQQQQQQHHQQPASVQKKPLSSPNPQSQIQFLEQVTPPPAQQSPQPAPNSQHQQQLPNKGCSSSGHSMGEVVVEVSENNTQVSTPIWPPSGIAPGVTLTECSSGEEKPSLPLWTEGITCERRNSSSLGRDAPNRASWPAASSLLWAGLDGFISEGESEEGGNVSPINLPQYRRHSTDITHLSFNSTSPLIAKTKSSDNITVGNELSGKCSCAEGNLQRLLLLNSILPAPAPPTPTSQYSLFSST